jgi:pimeloyl-ACP methyl ester carboxylesterase
MKRSVPILLSFIFLMVACKTAATSLTPTIPPTETHISPTKTVSVPTETATPSITESPTPLTTPADTVTILEELGGYACQNSEFTCVDLEVPLDHFNPANSESIKVVFGVLPASGEAKGMFVTATGGPGYAGLAAADDYTSYFDPSIMENFDIVFFDQRGIGQSGGMQCVNAAVAFYRADWRTDTPEHQSAFLNVANTFAQDCVYEMGLPVENLPFYSTNQAVEDLEVFRQSMGGKLLWLYGESYGTQYAQTYAAAHPEGLGGLILDGTVDLTLTGPEFYTGAVQSFYNDLIDTLNACSADETCSTDFGGDALTFYQDLAAEILVSPQTVSFPLPSGGLEDRLFSYSDFEYVVSSELYTEGSRQMLLRALASAYRGDLIPLLRLLYVDLYQDPQTLEPIPYPDYSDAAYYTVTCDDYSYYSGTPDERAQAMLTEGVALAKTVPYLSSIFYGDIPCIFWPVQGEAERPAPLEAFGIPALILGATADPITPVQYGTDVFSHLADGYLITTQGGAHITFGRGNACPDEIVTAFLVEDKIPAERQTTCEGVLYNPYVPLAALTVDDFTDTMEVMMAVDNEIYYLPEYYYWDVETPTAVACPFGGTMHFEATDVGDILTLEQCAFVNSFVLTGSGGNDYDAGLFTLEVTVSGVGAGSLSYTRDDNQGTYTLTGDYNGTPVELSR